MMDGVDAIMVQLAFAVDFLKILTLLGGQEGYIVGVGFRLSDS